MRYSQIQNRLLNHPKMIDAPDSSWAAWIKLVLWVGEQETRGFIPESVLRSITGSRRFAAVSDLTNRGMLDPAEGGVKLHDYADWQPDVSHSREQTRERVRRHRTRNSDAAPCNSDATRAHTLSNDCEGSEPHPNTNTPPGNALLTPLDLKQELNTPLPPKTGEQAVPEISNESPVTPSPVVPTTRPPKAGEAEVQQVWAAYCESTQRTSGYQLDAARRRIIGEALSGIPSGRKRREGYPLPDVLDAVRGWEFDPWPDRKLHNGLDVLLRDAEHIEKFRDLARSRDRDRARLSVVDSNESSVRAHPMAPDDPREWFERLRDTTGRPTLMEVPR